MEPVTHVLTGACLARTGLNRRAAYTTLAMAIAAEFPDIDTLWSLRGPVAGFTHHRGITHTFVGLPFEAALIVAAIYAIHRWREKRYAQYIPSKPSEGDDHVAILRPLTEAPVRWGLLYGFALLALLSHLLLDFTNNYGLRPFFPFNAHWYAASIVFIFDPLIFLLLLLALILPAVFALVHRELSRRRQPFRPRWWSAAALMLIVCLWTLRYVEHERAINLLLQQSAQLPQPQSERLTTQTPSTGETPAPPPPAPVYLPVQRALASPDPFSPFLWNAVADFGPFYQLADVDTRRNTVDLSGDNVAKPQPTSALLAAEASPLGRAYLDWSSMPFIFIDASAIPGETIITFADPRFMGHIPLLPESGRSPLTGVVQVDTHGRVVLQEMDGRAERAAD